MDDARTGRTPTRESGIRPRPRSPDEDDLPRLEDVGPQARDWTPALLEELLPALGRAVTSIILDSPALAYDRRDQGRVARHLRDREVSAFGGIYADCAVHYTLWYSLGGLDRLEGSADYRQSHAQYRDEVIIPTLTQFCTGSGTYHDDGVDALRNGPLRLFELAGETPRVTIELDAEAWRDVDHRDTRERSLAVLTALSTVCQIELVVPPGLYAYLDRRHPAWSDDHLDSCDYLTQDCDTSRQTPATAPETVDPMEAWEALAEYRSGSGRLRILAHLPENETRQERDLARDVDVHLEESTVTAYAAELEKQGLVTVDRRGRYNALGLTPLGRVAQGLISADYRILHPHQSDLELDLTATPQADTSTVCPPPTAKRRGEETPTAEEWLADTGDPTENGYVQWLGDSDATARRLRPLDLHRRLTTVSRVDGINLVDDPIAHLDDGRVSYLSFFDEEAAVTVEWGRSLPTLVRLATTLFSKRAFSKILTPSRLGDDFENVFDGNLDRVLGDLQQRTQIGWFGEDELRDYDQFRRRFLDVRRDLLKRLGNLVSSEDTDARQALYEDAHGFLTTATHLYRAVGIDVTLTVRFPDTATLLRRDDIRRDLLKFVAHTVPKHAAYSTHSYYRHAFETRADKVQFAMPPELDTADEISATATASWVFTGPTITAVKDDIVAALASRCEDDQFENRSHEPIPWDLPVTSCNMYAGIRHVVEQFAGQKGFTTARGSRDLRQVIRILMAVTGEGVLRGSPYAVAEAMQYLAQPLDPGQSIRATDIEYALGQLPANRLFPNLPPSVGKIARVLLAADTPLGRSEIIDRAGISGSTYDRRISALDDFDFVERNTDRKWDIQLSPWFVQEGSRSHPDLETISQGGLKAILRDVFDPTELTEEVSTALGSLDQATLCEQFHWLRGWWDVLETLTTNLAVCAERGLLGDTPACVQLGEPPPDSTSEQMRLQTASSSGYG